MVERGRQHVEVDMKFVANEFRPFELLKLIRDGKIRSIDDIPCDSSTLGMRLNRLIAGLCDAGLIDIDSANGSFTPTTKLAALQSALGVGLTELTPFGKGSVVVNPIFGLPETPPKPADVFVVMPFAAEFRPVYDDHLRAVAARLGVSIERADDFFSAGSVVRDVWNAISHARVVIADCTGRNPNVFYELGVAQTLGKPVILIAQNVDDMPFDVRHMRTIAYEPTPDGMQSFETALERTLTTELKRSRTLTEVVANPLAND